VLEPHVQAHGACSTAYIYLSKARSDYRSDQLCRTSLVEDELGNSLLFSASLSLVDVLEHAACRSCVKCSVDTYNSAAGAFMADCDRNQYIQGCGSFKTLMDRVRGWVPGGIHAGKHNNDDYWSKVGQSNKLLSSAAAFAHSACSSSACSRDT